MNPIHEGYNLHILKALALEKFYFNLKWKY